MRALVIAASLALLVLLLPHLADSALQPPRVVANAIHLASVTYGVPYRDMVAVARCETGNTFDAHAYNRSSGASGLFQFLRSTWARTPYARFDVFEPYANSLAAAWLYVQDGRSWREWTCAWTVRGRP